LDSGFTSPASTLSCSTTIERTFSKIASWDMAGVADAASYGAAERAPILMNKGDGG
jgi:hypothetical protein